MKLELKNLSAYLPYDLKVLVHGDFEMTMTYKRYIQPYDTESISIEGVLEDGYVKPILRPLSDLTKEIEHNGEKFVPSEIMCGGTLPISARLQQIEDYQKRTLLMPFGCVEYLLKWHFDIFGLIENGLAVDINTLNK